MSNHFDTLAKLLEESGATVCFCIVCAHKKEYGYCWSCRCHNHLSEPADLSGELEKMKATIAHWQDLAIRFKIGRDEAATNTYPTLDTVRKTRKELGTL